MKILFKILISISILFTLVACSAKIELKSDHVEIYAGQTFNVNDYLDEATKTNKNLVIEEHVDVNTPGSYEVKYSIGKTEKTLVLLVKDNPISLTHSDVVV